MKGRYSSPYVNLCLVQYHVLPIMYASLFLWEIGVIRVRLSPSLVRFGVLVGVPVCGISGVAVVARPSIEGNKQCASGYRHPVL
jgi:hypothetical protein